MKTITFEQFSAYLPYKIKASVPSAKTNRGNIVLTLTKLCKNKCYFNIHNGYAIHLYQNVKPFLKPLSDLIKEIELKTANFGYENDKLIYLFSSNDTQTYQDLEYSTILYLLKNHYDFHFLIEKGLAIDINTLKN